MIDASFPVNDELMTLMTFINDEMIIKEFIVG